MTTPTTLVRAFSTVGPCIVQGTLVRETSKFYCVADRFESGRVRKIAKTRWDIHTALCVSCREHPQSQYPNGYEN